jgi:hypothetical protein
MLYGPTALPWAERASGIIPVTDVRGSHSGMVSLTCRTDVVTTLPVRFGVMVPNGVLHVMPVSGEGVFECIRCKTVTPNAAVGAASMHHRCLKIQTHHRLTQLLTRFKESRPCDALLGR